jgi:hypothetical protein
MRLAQHRLDGGAIHSPLYLGDFTPLHQTEPRCFLWGCRCVGIPGARAYTLTLLSRCSTVAPAIWPNRGASFAVRRNILYGVKVIKICVDCKSYGYTADEMRLFISEAAKSGLKVAGHVQTHAGALGAIDAGLWSIEHSAALDDETHKLMAKKGIWRVGTAPFTTYHTNTQGAKQRFDRQVEGMKNAYANHVNMAFSTDADYYIPGMDRGQVVIDFLKSWRAAEIPAPEILKFVAPS